MTVLYMSRVEGNSNESMEELKISIIDIIDGTVVDGPGFRLSIYCAGCSHGCPGCHNPQSWNIANGKPMTVAELLERVKSSPWNVTFSGGDPFFQAKAFAELAQLIKSRCGKTIWCYTGYTIESLINEADPDKLRLLQSVDVLVDGPFIDSLKDEDLQFRGSSNQRILDSVAIGEALQMR